MVCYLLCQVLAFLLYTLSSIHRPANKKDGVNDEDQDEGFQELPSCYTNIAFDQTHDTLKEVGIIPSSPLLSSPIFSPILSPIFSFTKLYLQNVNAFFTMLHIHVVPVRIPFRVSRVCCANGQWTLEKTSKCVLSSSYNEYPSLGGASLNNVSFAGTGDETSPTISQIPEATREECFIRHI